MVAKCSEGFEGTSELNEKQSNSVHPSSALVLFGLCILRSLLPKCGSGAT